MLLTIGSLQAEQIFVLFDGTCGDRVLYEQAVANEPRADYYAYQFGFPGGDRLLLETGAEGATVQNYLPQDYLYCGDPRLNLELAGRVNAGVDQVFILLPANNNQFIIQPVVMATTLQRRGAVFTYQSSLAAFNFDMDNGIIGENLAIGDQAATQVYFEGRETSSCTGYYLFRQLKPGASYPVIDYKISPEIGIFERRLGSDGVSTTGGTIKAKEVNGLPIADYLARLCANAAVAATLTPAVNQYGQQVPAPPQPYTGSPAAYSNQQAAPASPFAQPESQVYAQYNPPVQPVMTSQIHTVSKGETLYALSRKYDISVDAIKSQNELSNNTLFPGQQLTVRTIQAAPVATTPQVAPQVTNDAVAMNPTVPTMPYNAGSVANSKPGAAQPTPYAPAITAVPQAYGTQQTSRSQTAVYGEDVHIVQPGETVASVALKYGYTSAKFREINELGPSEFVKVGSPLKTDDCNCPAPVAAALADPTVPAAPQAYGQPAPAQVQAYDQPAPAQVQAYGQPAPAQVQAYGQPAPAQVQAYGQPAPAQVQAYGQPASGQQPTTALAPAYRTPDGYQAPTTAPVAATTTLRAAVPPTITNNPNFGQVVPNASAPASTSMGQLESRGPQPVTTPAVSNPATYNAYPAPASAPTNAPSTYNAPQPVPNAYGTPVGVNAQAPVQAAANRSFHLVQEGESLYAISRRYGLTTDQLRAFNNLNNSSVIVPFQKLYVN
jgi:LysM repeat protein